MNLLVGGMGSAMKIVETFKYSEGNSVYAVRVIAQWL